MMDELMRRQDAIDAVHYYIESGYKYDIFQELKNLPSVEPDNQVHLCIFCKHSYPECQTEMSDVIFGNGIGHDNVCACSKFEIKPGRTAKVYKKQTTDRLYQFYCGECCQMIDCSFYEDYRSIKSYCCYCGAKLDWSVT